MQAVMSGQAAIAVVISVIELLTTISMLGKSKPSDPSSPGQVARTETSISASYFYFISTLCLLFSYLAYLRLTRMNLFRRTVARFEGAKVPDSTVEYEALPEDDPNPPAGSQIGDEENDDADTDLMSMSTSIGSLREREREMSLNSGGVNRSSFSLRDGEVESGPQSMGEVEPVINATFWDVWKVNALYNIAILIVYIVTLVTLSSSHATAV